MLQGIRVLPDPNVLVGFETADDAGVYRLDDRLALVQTVDFFTPVVDDPFTYGQIAASNALSDIYAMGGTPRFALSIVGFPAGKVDESVLQEIVRGGAEKMGEAGVPILGGHSVQDPEIKFGYCVTGVIDPGRIYTNRGALPEDRLLLTKPLGTGIITTGIKFEKTPPEVAEEAIRWMLGLNSAASRHLGKFRIHAVTDITGYGLVGHAYEMARASGVTFLLEADRVPLMKGVEELARMGMLPGGIASNRQFVGSHVRWDGVSELRQQILLDPQTAGGLLISLPEEDAPRLQAVLAGEEVFAQEIGRVLPQKEHWIEVRE